MACLSVPYGARISVSRHVTAKHFPLQQRIVTSSKAPLRQVKDIRSYNTETVSYLSHGASNRTVYLVGTAHVSSNSVSDVVESIELSKPDSVMVELCEGRARRLRSGEKGQDPKQLVQGLIGQLFGGKIPRGFGTEFLLKAGISGMYSVLRFYGLDPGAEFKTALQEADRRGLPVCYGDRDVDETMHLLRDSLASISLASLTAAPEPPLELKRMMGESGNLSFESGLETMKNRRRIALFREYMDTTFPDVMNVIVHQRDKIMVDNLLTRCEPGCIVAIVGMAHMDGIEREWERRGGEVFLHHDNSLRRQ